MTEQFLPQSPDEIAINSLFFKIIIKRNMTGKRNTYSDFYAGPWYN
ncbi:hypothetical protein J2TS4_37400 [Paenibacillus sp. J2TS4]|nr:hypothetical protein J2TS4_37400 [Paenibacillus sp. J2TS4]